jgi:SAM-dependent methyltransferase
MADEPPDFNAGEADPRLRPLLADYPAELFDTRLYRSIEWADRYATALAADILRRLGAARLLDRAHAAGELCGRLDLRAEFAPALAWLLERLRTSGDIAGETGDDGTLRYRHDGAWPEPDLDRLRALGLGIDPANRATLDLMDAAAAAYPAVATGAVSGREALSGLPDAALWMNYFANDNPLYAVNNRVAAIAAARRLPDRPELRILEVGAGTCGGTTALLDVLRAEARTDRLAEFVVTEPSAFFRRRGERLLKRPCADLPLRFAGLDIDQPWAPQGIAAGHFDLVYAVNVFHVADDLIFSLREARAALAEGGVLVAGECLRPFPGEPVYVEIVFQILDSFTAVRTIPEIRPQPGFLTPEQWCLALSRAGFAGAEITPDHVRIREIFPKLFAGAVCGR